MVTEKDRAHFRAIAEGLDLLEQEAIARAAARPAGTNIEIAFDLSRFVMSRSSDFSREDPVSIAQLWRERHVRSRKE